MAKIETLTDFADLDNEPTAATNLTANNTKIEDAFDNTISRDGSTPNSMEADLDLNSNKVINLATPTSNTDAATKEYVDSGVTAIVGYAEEWANKAEDSLVSTDAGGDGVDDYSAKHFANKASASASAASNSESNTAADAISTAADVVSTNADVLATAADRIQTGLDAVATAANLVETAQDVVDAEAAQAAAELARDASIAASETLAWGYSFSDNTADSDPGSTVLKFNNATLGSATFMYISETADEGSVAAAMDAWDDSSSTIKAVIKIRNPLAPTNWAEFYITGTITDAGSYRKVPVSYIASNGSFSDTDELLILPLRNGDAGTGAVDSFNGRTGAITPAASDYDASQIDNDSGVSGAFVDDALDTLDNGKLDKAGGTLTGNLTVQGAFTSKGIDDNATGRALLLTDNIVTWGKSGSASTVHQRPDDTTYQVISGGSAYNSGAILWIFGPSHSSSANDFVLKHGTTDVIKYDYSANATTFKGHAVRGQETTLTDGSTINIDMSDNNFFKVTLGGNRTLANPTNMVVGQTGRIRVNQDGTGSRTLAFGSYYKFAGGTAPTLTTTASASDLLYYEVLSSTEIFISSALDIS